MPPSPNSRRDAVRRPPAAVTFAAAAALLAALTGCATQRAATPIPDEIRTAPTGNLQLVEARQAPKRHVGTPVRWGGTVVDVRRDEVGNVDVEILARPLDEDGRPVPAGASDGRFVVRATPEVDPELYRIGSDVTVAGTLEPPIRGRIGQQSESFPVVRVAHFVRWQPDWRRVPYDDPWYWHPRAHFGIGYGHFYGHRLHHFGYGYPYAW